jgi:tyrosine phenol-lyase
MPSSPMPFEPFKIKMVEKIPLLDAKEREEALLRARYNPFKLKAREVTIDLLTDSGTGAMSDRQWSAMMMGDESYAGAESFLRFEESVRDITGKKFIVPTHQGRSAENLFFGAVLSPGDVVVSNTHFDTTQANVETKGGVALDLPCSTCADFSSMAPFKGDIDLDCLERILCDGTKHVVALIMTVTNNTCGGQPVSMANIRAAREISKKHGVPLYIDAARYAENCYFIKTREKGYAEKSLIEIAREMFSYADGALMSAKKDAYVNIGGFFATDNEDVFRNVAQRMVVVEGFMTYGGLAGRDLEAIAQGLKEGMDFSVVRQRVEQVARLHSLLAAEGVPMIHPAGGHGVYLDANAILPNLAIEKFRGWSLANEMYLRGGVRCVEIGCVMFMKQNPKTGECTWPKNDLVRLAIPRRVYTDRHMDFVARTVIDVFRNSKNVSGYRMTYAPAHLKHFLAEFEPA